MINGIGWLDDRHSPSPILCDAGTLFVYTLISYFAIMLSFILMVTKIGSVFHDGSLHCLFISYCKSYEIFNQSINHSINESISQSINVVMNAILLNTFHQRSVFES